MKYFCLIILACLFPVFIWAQGSLLLVGGGSDGKNTWSDGPYGWFVEQAGYGKIINIDTDEASSYYPGYFTFLGADASSEPLQIPHKTAANDSATYKKLISAQGIFIEGGNQWPYVNTWKGTLVEDALHYIFEQGGAIGGTSAGLAVLGEVVFDARYGSAYPDLTAYNPYNSRISFTDDFLDILPDVLTDSHFHSRIRIGRLVPMLARRIQDWGQEDIIGIGVADASALTIDPDRIATAWGRGSVTILHKGENSLIDCRSNVPLTFTDIHFDQLVPGVVYDLNSKEVLDPGPYMQAPGDFPAAGAYQDTTLNGSDPDVVNLGEVVIGRLTDAELNAWNGRLTQSPGMTLVPHTVIIPQIYDGTVYDENRIMGGMWGCATNPHFTAIYLDDGCLVDVNEDGIMTVHTLAYVLDTWGASYIGVNGTRTTNYSGITGAKLHFLGPDRQYDLKNHQVVTAISNLTELKPQGFLLHPNYPNPFNHHTAIRFQLDQTQRVKIQLYNAEGRLLTTLFDAEKKPGFHEIIWDAQALSSGVYYYRLSAGPFHQTGKAILLK